MPALRANVACCMGALLHLLLLLLKVGGRFKL
jgi:hypothetical protein